MITKTIKLNQTINLSDTFFKLITGWGHTRRNMNININDSHPEPPDNQQTYSPNLKMGQS